VALQPTLIQHIAYLWMVDDDGAVVMEEQFSDWDQALQAAGLSKPWSSPKGQLASASAAH
jgi:hypothetical protein